MPGVQQAAEAGLARGPALLPVEAWQEGQQLVGAWGANVLSQVCWLQALPQAQWLEAGSWVSEVELCLCLAGLLPWEGGLSSAWACLGWRRRLGVCKAGACPASWGGCRPAQQLAAGAMAWIGAWMTCTLG